MNNNQGEVVTHDGEKRGAVALWLERKTLIHEVVGSSPGSGLSAPPRVGCWITHMELAVQCSHALCWNQPGLYAAGFMCAIQHPTLGGAMTLDPRLEPTTS